jgi:hypothetical protein
LKVAERQTTVTDSHAKGLKAFKEMLLGTATASNAARDALAGSC